ncbi:GrpB family protein [Nocardiopsis sediminis]|uniref:GrpB family protein n=1 Tax=Nocardiopsis sediminis TaxID=1778267 RepID=A0ABV8FL36_9ACTN
MAEPVPAWAYERVELSTPDPRWAGAARLEAERLAHLLAPWLAGGVEHIGSTAVPGLAAKPVIDLMAAVTGIDEAAREAGDRRAADGWHHVPPPLDGRPWRRFYVKPDESGLRRRAHLHILEQGHPRWADQLAFRDALRADPGLRRAYTELKRRLAREHPDDRERYTDAKSAFVALALGRSGEFRYR